MLGTNMQFLSEFVGRGKTCAAADRGKVGVGWRKGGGGRGEEREQ